MAYPLLSPTHLIIYMPFMFLWLAIYSLPTIVASLRSHPKSRSIALVDFLLGWTLVGWVVARIWACTTPQPIMVKSSELPL
jgi:hypothetical protein